MPPESRDLASLMDMPGALRKIDAYLAGKTLDDLRADELLQDGLIRQFTIFGEAATRLSPCSERYEVT